jgi:ABC-type uncharacterized transport system involved in gliding motility auxiliary subunit
MISEEKKSRFNLSLDNLKSPALLLGVLLLAVGLGAWLVNGFDTVTRILLAAGILLVGVFVAIDPEDVWHRLTARGSLYSGNTLLLALALLGILGLINVVAQNRHQRWDLTANQQYSLSEQTLSVLASLPSRVQMTAFYQDDDGRKQGVQDLLKEYEVRSGGQIGVEFVDPVREPTRAQQAAIKELGTTVLTMADRQQTVTGTRESDFTTALTRLINPQPKKIYFLIGHQERRIDGFEQENYGQLKTSLESDNFVVETLLLAGGATVPDDATVVVIAQPRSALAEEEKQAVRNYVWSGGKLMLLTQPSTPQSPQVSLNDLLSDWKVEIADQPVAEGNPQLVLFGDPFTPVVASYPSHRITEGLGFTVFPFSTHINQPTEGAQGATVVPLLRTSDRSWAETNRQALSDPGGLRFDEGSDPKGPLTIGLAIEAAPSTPPPGQTDQEDQKKTRVVVFGNANFPANGVVQRAGDNRDLFLNAANWLAEDEQLIAIRPKERDNRQMFLTAAQSNLVLFSSILFVPAIVLALGGLVWWSRR